MNVTSVELTRKQLYDRVWKTPMRTLAKEFGLSDVGLAKICRKYDIPRPPVGYWAKLANGKPVTKPSLPSPDDQETIRISPSGLGQNSISMNSPDAAECVSVQPAIETQITVAKTLRGAHPWVSQANEDLAIQEPQATGLISSSNNSPIHLEVSRDSANRALRIMDALIKTWEHLEYPIQPGLVVQIQDVDIGVSISEKLDSFQKTIDEEDLSGRYKFRYLQQARIRKPSGKLEIRLDHPIAHGLGLRRAWGDTSTKDLEEMLNRVINGMVTFAMQIKNKEKENRKHREEEHRKQMIRQEKLRLLQEKKKQQQVESERVNDLMKFSRNWNESQQLRSFIEARKQSYLRNHDEIEAGSDMEQWLQWAIDQADRLDPLCNSPFSILDEELSSLEEKHWSSRWG